MKLVEHDTRLRDQAVPDWRGGPLDWINRIAALAGLTAIAIFEGARAFRQASMARAAR